MGFLKIIKGLIKPLPGSGIVKEVKEAFTKGKELNNYKKLIRLGFYLISAVFVWFLISKGIISSLPEVIEFLKEAKTVTGV